MRAGQDLAHIRKQLAAKIDRVLIDVEIGNRGTAKVVIEHERIVATAAENLHATTDIDERVVSGRSLHCRSSCRDDGDRERILADMARSLMDLGIEGQRQSTPGCRKSKLALLGL